MGVVDIEKQFTAPAVQRAVKRWRKRKDDVSICKGFCKRYDDCPLKLSLPDKGYCDNFVINASTATAVQELYDQDQRRFKLRLTPEPTLT